MAEKKKPSEIMVAYPLSEVIGAIAVGFAEAQHISDEYTEELDNNKQGLRQDDMVNVLLIPNAQIDTAEITMRFAIAGVDTKSNAGRERHLKELEIFVRAEDLEQLPPNVVSEVTFKMNVEDTATTVEDEPA